MSRYPIENNIPLHQRYSFNINEAALYSGIGTKKLRELMKRPDCNFVIKVGVQKDIIRREKFEEFLNTHDVLY